MSSGIPFGNYRLIRRLASGGMAEVFLATQKGPEGFERTVAIKRILPHLADVPQFVEMFMDEARLAARLSHPNVCHIYEFGQVNGSYFIAMEFIDGMDLSAVILSGERDPLPIEHGARLIADTAAALNHAHNLKGPDGKPLGIVHRDISPQNILVSFDGTVKVVDFGIAKAAYHINRTRPGVVRGKYAYMSPEQVDGRKLDGRSDLFCAGVVLYELATGGMLFSRADAMKAMIQIRDGEVPPPRRQGQPLPAGLERIVMKALAHDPEHRYPTGAAMQLDLEEFLRGCSPTSNSVLLGEHFSTKYRKYHPEPVITPDDDEGAPAGTAAVAGQRIPSGTAAVPGSVSNVVLARHGEALGAGIDDPQGLLVDADPTAASQPNWTDMIVRKTAAGEFKATYNTTPSLPEYETVIPTVAGAGDDHEDEPTNVDIPGEPSDPTIERPRDPLLSDSEESLISQPTLLAAPSHHAPSHHAPGRTGPSPRGRATTGRGPGMGAGSMGAAPIAGVELFSSETVDIAMTQVDARGGGRPRTAGSLELADTHADLRDPSASGLRAPVAPAPRRGHRGLLLTGVLLLLAGAGGLSGYWIAESGPSANGALSDARSIAAIDLGRAGGAGAGVAGTDDGGVAVSAADAGGDRGAPAQDVGDPPAMAQGKLRITSHPRRAAVTIDGQPLNGRTPLSAILAAGLHTVTVSQPRYEDMTATVEVPPGGSVRQDFRLKRALAQVVSLKSPRAKVRTWRRTKTGRRPSVKPTPPRPTGTGYVSVSTIPWSRVYLGARFLGDTPLHRVPLPAGSHRLRLVNPKAEPQVVNVNISPERTTKVRLRLRMPQ